MFGLAFFETIKDIKSSLKGIKLMILLFEIIFFVLFFQEVIQNDSMVHPYIIFEMLLLSCTIAFLLIPKMHKVLFVIPISTSEGYKYFKYKTWLMSLINILVYLALAGLSSMIFKFDYIDAIIILVERYMPMLIFICAYIIALTNGLVKQFSKLDNLSALLMIMPICNFEVGTMGLLKNEVINFIIVLFSYISAVIMYIIIAKKSKVNLYITDYETHSKYSKLKNIFRSYSRIEEKD